MAHSHNIVARGARVLLGAGFVFFGLNGLLQFMPQPAPPPEAGAFLGALAATGYMFPLLKSIEIVAGLMLLANFRAPLALLLLSPIAVNIIFYHLFLDPAGIAPGAALTGLGIFVATRHWEAFAPLFAGPDTAKARRLHQRTAQAT